MDRGMKAILFALFVALLMVGCGDDSPSTGDPKLDKFLNEAIDAEEIQFRGKEGEQLAYAPNEQTPYTGWTKGSFDNGQPHNLTQYKDGKKDGVMTRWYPNGQKIGGGNYKEGKKDGLWIYYNEDGTELGRETYKDGKLVD